MAKRKSFLFMMVAVLVMALVMPAYADDAVLKAVEEKPAVETQIEKEMKITKEQALDIAKKALKDYFNMTLEDKKYNLQIENRQDWGNPGKYVWAMNWNYNDQIEYAYAYVTIDGESGKILEMNKDSGKYGQQNTKVTTITREEAREKAEKFIEKILPQTLTETTLKENYDDYYRISTGGSYPIFYYLNYIRLIDGIKYDANYINVGIDGATGEIRNFSYRWDEISDFPKADGVLHIDEATKIFHDKIKMDLTYLPIRDQMKYESVPKAVKLAYRAAYDFGGMVDAKTGAILGWDGKDLSSTMEWASLTEKQINDILMKAKPIIKREKEITKEQAKEASMKILADEIGEEIKINAINYVEGDGGYWEAAGRKAWNIEYSVVKKSEQDTKEAALMPMMNGRIMIDALTEEVLAFNKWYDYMGPYDGSFEPAMTWTEAYDKAMTVIEKYYPDKIDEIKTDQVKIQYNEMIDGKQIPPMEYYFYFPRRINGVLYEENQINISFNNKTGKLQSLACRWTEDINFPSVKDALSEKEAKDILFKYNEVELAYNRFNTGYEYRSPQFDTKLVYKLEPKKPLISQYMLMDGITGKPIDYNGKDIPIEGENNFEGLIKDHWIEKTAKILAQQGILDKETFKPDKSIKKLDLIKILVKAKGMDYYYPMTEAAYDLKFSNISQDSEDYPYIQRAMIYGIIENGEGEFDGDKEVSREELAVMVVKLLQYDTLAKAKDIFTLSFNDKDRISKDLTGYVAICQGLKIIGSDGNFRPKDMATMAEGADMVYRSLGFMNK